MGRLRIVLMGLCVWMAALAACGEDTADEPAADDAQPSLAQELGLTLYSGAITPIEEDVDDNTTTYTFDPEEGPICMRGDPYRMSVRERDSEDLVIFLQGGGACLSEFCLAVTKAPAGIPGVDILRPDLPENPVADWDVVYLPYCDGSFFAGDVSIDDNLNGNGTRHHRGLANLTAALEVSLQHFPNPRRILLAGSSGGAYGMMLGGPLVRHYYPDAELVMMADSGIGLGRHNEPEFIQGVLEEFNMLRFLPKDCPQCQSNGHLTGVVGYFLEREPDVRIGLYSAWYDAILARTFFQRPSDNFADGLDEQTERLHQAHPERFRRFINDGIQHTSLLGDATGIIGTDLGAVEVPPDTLTDLISGELVIGGINTTEIDGLTMATWLSALIEGDLDVWVDVQQERGPSPD